MLRKPDTREYLLLLLLLVGAISIMFGMAVSTTAAYILVVILAAPALQSLGVSLVVAHFMVFYLAMLSAITPPVAGAVIVASGIANSPYIKTAITAMRVSVALFILPFAFCTYPQLVMGTGGSIVAALIVLTGLAGVAYGLNYRSQGVPGAVGRALCAIGGIAILLNASQPAVYASLALIVAIISSTLILQLRQRVYIHTS